MQVWYDAAGRVPRQPPDAEAGSVENATPPDDVAGALTFDEDTNPQLVRALMQDDPKRWRVANGGTGLTRDGEPVPIQPPGTDYLTPEQMRAIRDRLAPDSPNLTQAELKRALRILFRLVLRD